MNARTALLLHIDAPYNDSLTLALQERGYRVINILLPEQARNADTSEDLQGLDTRQVLEWLRTQNLTIDCLITSCCLPVQVPPAKDINYPPYDLYEHLLTEMQQRGYGRIVNLFYGPGSAKGLSMHQLQTIEHRYDHLFANSNILFNSVNIGEVKTMSATESERIFKERLETILWLATTEEHEPNKQFFRGYTGHD